MTSNLHDDPEYIAFLAAEEARGPLAFAPDTMACYECGGFDGVTAPERKVIGLPGPTGGADPSERYKLECGHITIAM